MSLKAMTWVMHEAPVKDPTQLLVLYALADRASDDGTAAWPAQSWIAERARCSDRTVRRHLAELETAGVIQRGDQELVAHQPAQRRPVVWDLNMMAGQNVRPDTGGQSDRTTVSDKPSLTTYGSKTVRPRTKRATQIQDSGFEVTDDMRQWASVKAPAVGVEYTTERFVNYWEGTGRPMKSWPATWRNWMLREQERLGGAGVLTAPKVEPSAPVSKQQWCEEHGVTVTQWDDHSARQDREWMQAVIDGRMVDRRG